LETPALVRHNHAQGHSVGTSSPREVRKLLHQSIFSTTKHQKCALKNNSAFQNVHFSQMKITGKVEEIESDLHDQLKWASSYLCHWQCTASSGITFKGDNRNMMKYRV